MARKTDLDRGNDNYTLLIQLIMSLTPKQAKMLLQELNARYSRRARTKLYNSLGEIDKEHGRIRLTEHQYKTLRVKYGDTYMNRALQEMDNYIHFLEEHQDENRYKQQLLKYNSQTHAKYFDYGGWVYEKYKSLVCQKVSDHLPVNPFLIEDYSVARQYVESLSPSMRKMPDVMFLAEKFPELNDLLEE